MMGIVIRFRSGASAYGDRAPEADSPTSFGLKPWGLDESVRMPLADVIVVGRALVSVRRAETIGRVQREGSAVAITVACAVAVLVGRKGVRK
jgi:hypothetical protein